MPLQEPPAEPKSETVQPEVAQKTPPPVKPKEKTVEVVKTCFTLPWLKKDSLYAMPKFSKYIHFIFIVISLHEQRKSAQECKTHADGLVKSFLIGTDE